SGAVGALQCAFAARRSSVAFGGFAVIAFVVSAITFGMFLSTGARYGPAVYATLVASSYAGAAWVFARFSRALALPFSAGAVLWSFASAVAMIALLADSTGPQLLLDLA